MSERLDGILGPGARYRGDLLFDGRVRIDGELIGNLRCDDLVEVSPSGRVQGEVVAPQVLVLGEIAGSLRAAERVTVFESGRIYGSIDTPWLDVRVGAQIVGRLQIEREEATATIPADVTAPTDPHGVVPEISET